MPNTSAESAPKNRKRDLSFLSFLFVLSASLHFIQLDQPPQVVFDEFYYGASVNNYLFTHKYNFIAHPPMGQLFCAGSAKLFGYSGKGIFDTIGHANEPSDMLALRMGPAIMGTLIPLLFYVVLRLVGALPVAGFLAALAILLDNGLLIQTRTVAHEGFILFNLWGSILVFLIANRKKTQFRLPLLFLGGIMAGNAFATKFTGLSILPVLGLLSLKFHGWIWPRKKKPSFLGPLIDSAVAATGFGLLFIFSLYLHHRLLYLPGDASRFFNVQNTFWGDSYRFIKAIFEANRNLKATHPSASMWWSWPFDYAAVYLWIDRMARLYFIGNIVNYLGTTALLLGFLSLTFFKWLKIIEVRYSELRRPQGELFFLFAYACAFLPHILIARVMFLYHYLPPLTFALAFSVFWLQSLGWFRDEGFLNQRKSYYALILLIVASFAFFWPITFATQTTQDYFNLINKLWIRWI